MTNNLDSTAGEESSDFGATGDENDLNVTTFKLWLGSWGSMINGEGAPPTGTPKDKN